MAEAFLWGFFAAFAACNGPFARQETADNDHVPQKEWIY
jgi:hypothetical protein